MLIMGIVMVSFLFPPVCSPISVDTYTVKTTVIYQVRARFLLVNNNNFTVTDYVYVSLPQNTTFQTSRVVSMNPPPIQFLRDDDGNLYTVVQIVAEPGARVWINATYVVEVKAYSINEEKHSGEWPPLDLVRKYTSSTGYWNIYNDTLIELAYKTAFADKPLEIAKKLAEWVVRKVNYKVNFGRLGSDHAVSWWWDYSIIGDCVEVADVYVTMARILGLPARTAYGFLLEDYRDIYWLNMTTMEREGDRILEHWGGHMWPQVYVIPFGWIDVDMLDGLQPNVGIYSARHIILGVEETKYYGSGLSSGCVPSYLALQYVDYTFEGEEL